MIFLSLLVAAVASSNPTISHHTPARSHVVYLTSFFNIRVVDYRSYPKCEDPSTPPEKICANQLEDMWSFDLRTPPKWLTRNIWIYTTKDGTPVGADARTSGVENQQEVFNYLKTVYGTPANYRVATVRNAFNASYSVIHAKWHLSNKAIVEFTGAKDSLDEGEVQYLPG